MAVIAVACSHATQTAPAAAHAGHELGSVHFPISCSPHAQQQFDHAVALLHHMTYPEARHVFEEITAEEPRCAMAHWGVAMTLFQPLWPTRPGPKDLQRGWDEVQEARAAAVPTDRERFFIDAAEAFFTDPSATDYWARIGRWEKALERAYAALPEDSEVQAFYALAHLATTPAT
ncbi:MAG TPA: hypothetical protein VM733_04755, partial [Thermoanaerobaculia bacterium]|nr:hypothetical protein [Thermoanaerobaculia bacterium]